MFQKNQLNVVIVLLAIVLGVEAVESDELPNKYRYCLTDHRIAEVRNYSDISCKYILVEEGDLEIYCLWNGSSIVGVNYVLPANGSVTKEKITPNCSAVRRVEIISYEEHFIVDLDVNARSRRFPATLTNFVNWEKWIQWTTPVQISLMHAREALPTFKNFTRLRNFSLHYSHHVFPKGEEISATLYFPDLPPSVEEISLAHNNLTYIPHTGNNTFFLLRRLDMSHNELTKHLTNLHEPFPTMPVLEHLDLSHNSLVSLGEEFASWFPNLKWLDVSHNEMLLFSGFDSFPKQLKFLNISHNDGIRGYNKMKSDRFPSLEILDISYLSTIPEKYNFFSTLMAYEINAPRLRILYASGYDNTTIKDLKLDYLRMKINQENFPVLVNCSFKMLDLSNGKIRFLSNLGLNQTYVVYLDISNNEISHWGTDNIFANENGSMWTKRVNLSSNAIRIMEPNMLRSLSGLSKVDVSDNPYECNTCSIRIFQTWLHEQQPLVAVPPMCGSPPEMRRRLVTASDFYEEVCVLASPLVVWMVTGGVVIASVLMLGVLLCHCWHELDSIRFSCKLCQGT